MSISKKQERLRQIKDKKSRDLSAEPKCGLCGKRGKLTKTLCCDNWICDDVENYRLFSYARNSCYRNHDRYTLCSSHFSNDHKGDWQECEECKDAYDTEDYVDFGTNEHNFVKLKNPPKYEPTRCSKCNTIINRADGGYSSQGGKFFCMKCSGFSLDFFQ